MKIRSPKRDIRLKRSAINPVSMHSWDKEEFNTEKEMQKYPQLALMSKGLISKIEVRAAALPKDIGAGDALDLCERSITLLRAPFLGKISSYMENAR